MKKPLGQLNHSKDFLFSVIVPVYNEELRINNLPLIIDYLKTNKFKHEVVVVNDGSTDNTLRKLKQFQKKYKFKVVSYDVNRGKGYAIKKGMLLSKGDFKLFTDIDLSTPIEEFKRFLPYIKTHEIAIATRKKKGAKLKVRQNKIRENLGKAYTAISKRILNLELSDFTCGFKFFSKRAADEIFSRCQIERWGFDPEILYIAGKRNIPVKEVPVVWINNPNSEVRFPQDAINSLKELIAIRINDMARKYD